MQLILENFTGIRVADIQSIAWNLSNVKVVRKNLGKIADANRLSAFVRVQFQELESGGRIPYIAEYMVEFAKYPIMLYDQVIRSVITAMTVGRGMIISFCIP